MFMCLVSLQKDVLALKNLEATLRILYILRADRIRNFQEYIKRLTPLRLLHIL